MGDNWETRPSGGGRQRNTCGGHCGSATKFELPLPSHSANPKASWLLHGITSRLQEGYERVKLTVILSTGQAPQTASRRSEDHGHQNTQTNRRQAGAKCEIIRAENPEPIGKQLGDKWGTSAKSRGPEFTVRQVGTSGGNHVRESRVKPKSIAKPSLATTWAKHRKKYGKNHGQKPWYTKITPT